ncbi:ATP-binding cassette domain-containing protein [Micromonospora sp. WMMD1082]|nr:ATP-binding cassette domain-containing protein [Micromonospora sp. WMMD1082]MDG4795426.1 ATP-binding cassette domain-containing protein [Micromonospora sp. WMMD1082]
MVGVSVPVVEAERVAVRIRRRAVVHSADLVSSVGVTGLVGPNGAGKTTLLRALATALPVGGGRLRIFGADTQTVRDLSEVRRRIGYAPQHPMVLRHLRVAEQVAYLGWMKGLSTKEAMQRARAVLERVDLADRAESRTRSLSGGMLRRLAIAMALVNDPHLLLLDEPTAGLDPDQREQFRVLVTELGRERAVLLSTHLLDDVASVCSQVVVLVGGRTVFHGTVDALAAAAPNGSATPTVYDGYAALTGAQR